MSDNSSKILHYNSDNSNNSPNSGILYNDYDLNIDNLSDDLNDDLNIKNISKKFI